MKHLFFSSLTLLALGGCLLTSCSDDNEPQAPPTTGSGEGTARYVIAATTQASGEETEVLLTASSLDEGTVTTVNAGLQVDGSTSYWAFNREKYLYALKYNDGNAGTTQSFYLNSALNPAKRNMVQRGGLAVKQVKIEYFGKPAHGTRPEEGINALSAVIQTFNLMDAQRALLPLKSSVNGYIIEGGTASNVIPEYASCEFCIRGDKVKDLLVVEAALKRAIQTVNTLFGTTAKTQDSLMYTERYSNRMMDETFKGHLEEMGETVEYPAPTMKYGSSDIGNVSLEVPTIQPYLKIGDADTHTHGFLEAAKSAHGLEQAIKGAKALALTACDILESKELQEKIRAEFEKTVPRYTREQLGYHG